MLNQSKKKKFKNKDGLISRLDRGINKTNKIKEVIAGPEIKKIIISGHGTTLTDNETRDIIKFIGSLENRDTLLKGTTEEVIIQERELLGNLLAPLMKVGLPLMKNVLTPLGKSLCYH